MFIDKYGHFFAAIVIFSPSRNVDKLIPWC